MPPFSLMRAGVSVVAKSFSVFSCTNTLTRCPSVLPTAYVCSVKRLTSEAGDPPKRPPNGYMRYFLQQKPIITRQNPHLKLVDITRKIAEQWKTMSPEQKQPFQEAFLQEWEQFKVDFKNYQAQLTPAQLQQQDQEKKKKTARRKVLQSRKELRSMGKPKRPRNSFNIFMSEHYEEATGATSQAKLKSLLQDWRNLLSHQKQVYIQLAEDDKIRYKNEMNSWEDHLVEIGRVDLIKDRNGHIWKKQAAEKEVMKAKTSVETSRTTEGTVKKP
ncbi:transcription factor A, mitochondrial [Pholidichthys leucotaenia]